VCVVPGGAYPPRAGLNIAAFRLPATGIPHHALGSVADIPEGEPVRRRAGAVDVVVVRRGAEVTCSPTHLSAPLSDGELVDADGDAELVCPWHGSTRHG
jgi:phenylpropionate dioxygenase-like ring-hydroxylating dioxygenase large terminal subunit